MDETWLYHYDPETKQQSMEWRYNGSPSPKNSECKNPLDALSPRFFGIKMASSLLIIFQRTKLSTRSNTHLCWSDAIEGHVEGKCRGKVTKGVLFLHDNALAHRALATQKKVAYLGFKYLDHPPYDYSPAVAPSDYHMFPGLKKTIERSPFFFRRGGQCYRRDLV